MRRRPLQYAGGGRRAGGNVAQFRCDRPESEGIAIPPRYGLRPTDPKPESHCDRRSIRGGQAAGDLAAETGLDHMNDVVYRSDSAAQAVEREYRRILEQWPVPKIELHLPTCQGSTF